MRIINIMQMYLAIYFILIVINYSITNMNGYYITRNSGLLY